jgi:hypothetical protein
LEGVRERLASHAPRDHGFEREDLASEQTLDLIVEAHIANAERAGTENPIAAIVDLLAVLVHRAEVAVAGEEVRVALRFRAEARL